LNFGTRSGANITNEPNKQKNTHPTMSNLSQEPAPSTFENIRVEIPPAVLTSPTASSTANTNDTNAPVMHGAAALHYLYYANKSEKIFSWEHFWKRLLIILLIWVHIIIVLFTIFYDVRATRPAEMIPIQMTNNTTYLFDWRYYSNLRYNGVSFFNNGNVSLNVVAMQQTPIINLLNGNILNENGTINVTSTDYQTIVYNVNPGTLFNVSMQLSGFNSRSSILNVVLILGYYNYNYWLNYYAQVPPVLVSYQLVRGQSANYAFQFGGTSDGKNSNYTYIPLKTSSLLYIVYYSSQEPQLDILGSYSLSLNITNYNTNNNIVSTCKLSAHSACSVPYKYNALLVAPQSSIPQEYSIMYQYDVSTIKVVSWSIGFLGILVIIDFLLIVRKTILLTVSYVKESKAAESEKPLNPSINNNEESNNKNNNSTTLDAYVSQV
jgi:hypothetical protein